MLHILIADDEPLVSDTLCRLLCLLGHEVAVAQSPQAALDYLQTHPTDLVLLDWLMPDGGGARVLEVMRSRGFSLDKVIMMSGSIDEQWAVGQPPLRVLSKPFRLLALQEMLAKVEGQNPKP